MYKWEKEFNKSKIGIRIIELQAETKRIANVTLAGNFANPDDRTYWEKRLRKLNSELSAFEEQLRPVKPSRTRKSN